MTQNWTAADAQYIRNVFSQPTGTKFLRMIKAHIPKIKAVTLEKVQIEALKKQGAEDLYEFILAKAEDVEPELREGVDWLNLEKEGD